MIVNDWPVRISTPEPDSDSGMQKDQGKSLTAEQSQAATVTMLIAGWRGGTKAESWLVYTAMSHYLKAFEV